MLNHIITAIKVKQWLANWDDVPYGNLRKKPLPHFYIFSINANVLKKLSKVYPRKADDNRDKEIGIQRKHDPERSDKIRSYVFGGFPWSDLSKAKQDSDEFKNLKMPGWLPTAIIANVISPNTLRGGVQIKDEDLIQIVENNGNVQLQLPNSIYSPNWEPQVPPIEIIDGQHRLWAFNKDEKLEGDFDLPVVAFYDLDVSWQAYLFYTINIKPKKINASLAFDLYPVLRVQDWLEKSPDGAFVYKETRAQELVEVLWSSNSSPWKDRINMLGERYDPSTENVIPTITQSAYIRSLMATFIKTSSSKNLGGLFGSELTDGNLLLWNRTQQAAFLILVWQIIAEKIKDFNESWALNIRQLTANPQPSLFKEDNQKNDPAFVSKLSLISTDQGVRGFLSVINDMVYVYSSELKLNEISSPDEIREDKIDHEDIKKCLEIFKREELLMTYLVDISDCLAKFDWRTASTPNLDRQTRQQQMVYKGSSGYKEIRDALLRQLKSSTNVIVNKNANRIILSLGYGNE